MNKSESAVLIRNVSVFDGSGSSPFRGEVLVQGNSIKAVKSGDGIAVTNGHSVIDGRGMTLMPGLIDGHAHLTYPFSIDRAPIVSKTFADVHMPPELATMVTLHNARTLLDHGFTGAYSAGGTTELMEVTLCREIEGGWTPGPRLRPAGTEGVLVSNDPLVYRTTEVQGVIDFINRTADTGAKIAKFLLSGPGFTYDEDTGPMYTDEQLAAVSRVAKDRNIWLSGHARKPEAIKQALRFGWRVIYHADDLDDEALAMMEERKAEIFVGPTISVPATLQRMAKSDAERGYFQPALDRYRRNVDAMRNRGIRILPFGDYGFTIIPHGHNARGLEYFVRHFGFSPAEALTCANKVGGELMDMKIGMIKEGYLADLLLVEGDPTKDINVVSDAGRLHMIMKDGQMHKAPTSLVKH